MKLFRSILLTLAMLVVPSLLLPVMAHADPVGTWKVVGMNADTGSKYKGTVRVSRSGDTYSVYWQIGKTEFYGTGLGAKVVKGRFEMGPASKEDMAISVGYISGTTFGMAMYFQQPDGSWQGVWTYSGSRQVAQENWTK